MTKLLLSLSFSFIALSTSCKGGNGNVYICTGPTAEVYHAKKTCRGLNRCSDEIKAITLTEAKSMGRRACKICVR